MAGTLTPVTWRAATLRAGWVVQSPRPRDLLMSKFRLWWLPRDLRAPAMRARAQALLDAHPEFLGWWREACGDPHDKCFVLRFPKKAWEIPWELLLESVSPHLQVTTSICRMADDGLQAPVAPYRFAEPLRILILKGEPDGLDLKGETDSVVNAWKSLERHIQEGIVEPIVRDATLDDLTKAVRDERPHVLWFSGHGRSRRDIELEFMGPRWVTAAEFAKAIQASGHTPLYAVFWACESSRGAARAHALTPPSLFESLRKLGVLAVLAMQSRVKDVSALPMAEGLFRHLAIGLPLETAVARVRASLAASPPAGAHPTDWASPVVWSAGEPARQPVEWRSTSQRLAQLELIGRMSIVGESTVLVHTPPDGADRERASSWTSVPRTWIVGEVEDGENRVYWVRTLRAIQVIGDRCVMAVELQRDDPVEALRRWAEALYSRLVPGDMNDEVTRIIEQMRHSPTIAWPQLCGLPTALFAISNPPGFSTDWFWSPLRNSNVVIVVVSTNQVEPYAAEDWRLDTFAANRAPETIDAAISQAPRLARALAWLNTPLAPNYLSVRSNEGSGRIAYADWPLGKSVTVQTPGGPVIAASARDRILQSTVDENMRQTALRDCIEILGNPDLALTPKLRQTRLAMLMAARRDIEALVEARVLLDLYIGTNRPAAAHQVVRRLGGLKNKLPTRARLIAAWAGIVLGKVPAARYWLEHSEPDEPLDRAWRRQLLGEIKKVEGDRDGALAEIDDAIKICVQLRATRDAAATMPLLSYRQDRARILQFLYYRPQAALQEYEQLIQEWSDVGGAELVLAVVKRNFAECLRTLSSQSANPAETLQRARGLLEQARVVARDHPQALPLAEIIYEESRLASQVGQRDLEAKLLVECRQASQASQHGMLLAIVENRQFWNRGQFKLEEWNRISILLDGWPHGWAIRTLIDGRLRAACNLIAGGDVDGAEAQLLACLTSLQSRPAFNRGSDQRRIASTHAGLQVIANLQAAAHQRPNYWETFKQDYEWAAEWLARAQADTARDVWRLECM